MAEFCQFPEPFSYAFSEFGYRRICIKILAEDLLRAETYWDNRHCALANACRRYFGNKFRCVARDLVWSRKRYSISERWLIRNQGCGDLFIGYTENMFNQDKMEALIHTDNKQYVIREVVLFAPVDDPTEGMIALRLRRGRHSAFNAWLSN